MRRERGLVHWFAAVARRRAVRQRAAALAIILPLGTIAAAAAWVGDLTAGAAYDGNLSRAEPEQDQVADALVLFGGAAGQALPIGRDGRFTWLLTLDGEWFDDVAGLRRVTPGASLAFRRKLRLGQDAPYLLCSASGLRDEFDSDGRTGWRTELALAAGRSLPALSVEGGVRWEHRDAHADPFDQEAWTGEVSVDWALPAVSLHAGYALRLGDVTSSARPDPRFRDAASAREPDPVFGADFVSYRLDATAHAAEIGIRRDLPHAAAVDLTYRFERTLAEAGFRYDAQRLTGSYRIRF